MSLESLTDMLNRMRAAGEPDSNLKLVISAYGAAHIARAYIPLDGSTQKAVLCFSTAVSKPYNPFMTREVAFSAFIALCLVCGCGAPPATPTETPRSPYRPDISVACSVTPTLRCGATLVGEDLTAKVTWSAADSFRLAGDTTATPSNAVEFPSAGLPRILRAANVYIRVDYTHPQWGRMKSLALYAYAVEPSGHAEPLGNVVGYVFRAGTTETIGSTDVEIIQGEGQGKHAVTLDANGSYMLEFLRLNKPFSMRASKKGYSPESKDNPGFDTPATPMHFYLTTSE